ncbi:hypothetical protein U472_07790 [Orenia metallireducens]|jgi:hypothetical protein|uniref:DUF4247 domain-containing protein n=1 Tax=Orenia metallireducens TaxID=1413210 RepID=A0A1C0AAN9_9FIRM|nr:DUF4247 domain-containing protein [Orenia metallireducens]OCL27352.1 hypothetical protein U472_07790 [Orenia metallireducens]
MFNESFTIGIIVLVIMVVIGVALFPSASIAKKIDEKFKLKGRENDVLIYQSPYNLTSTSSKISNLKRPRDIRTSNNNRFLLYENHIVVLKPKGLNNTDIEVMGHSRAYNRYRGPIVNYWGGTIRSGSIGRSSTRGGGFGFGK